MNIACPYCQHRITASDPKPGKYGPKCPKCAKKFALIVSDDPSKPPTVAQLKSEAPAEATLAPASAAAVEQTSVHSSADATGAWEAQAKAPAAEHDATGNWSSDNTAGGADQTAAFAPAGGVDIHPQPVTPSAPSATGDSTPGERLGGYQILKELGRGGMGSVYLAKQLSLDRNVALKVMQAKWASDPVFVARFTREAYAAAQLVHHNVVQIYDIGAERNQHFFSMEFVKGESLRDLVKRDGKVDIETAVGYVLQAARGLKFAHDQGLIHRDIKPDNLMLNDQGIVKVADLGLVKKAGVADLPASSGAAQTERGKPATETSLGAAGDITLANIAMGTPAYMAPEQSLDAAHVDQRADIYSLGCTLYVLVTGKPPFEGKTAVEVMSKHRTEPLVPPDVIVKRVPKELSAIIVKMTAKKPEERYADLAACIADLEKLIGVQSASTFTPKEEHANLLEENVKRFNGVTAAKIRPIVGWLFVLLCAVISLISIVRGYGVFGISVAALGLMTVGAAAAISGHFARSHLYLKAREMLAGASWGDWITWLAATLLLGGVVFLLNATLFWSLFGCAVVAVALGFGYEIAIQRPIAAEREAPIADVEKMLRGMRIQGLDEAAIRQFVCKYSGERWEEFFERLFGYEAKLAAREQSGRGEITRSRPKAGAWREPIIRWIETRQKQQREARERKHLQKVEEQSLKASGVSAAEAREKAAAAAGALLDNALELKRSVYANETPEQKRARIKAMLMATRAAGHKPPHPFEKWRGPLDLLIGARTRLIVGALLIAGCAFWMHQNNLIPGKELQSIAAQMKKDGGKIGDVTKSDQAKSLATSWKENYKNAKPLKVPVIGGLFNGFMPAIIGLAIIATNFFPFLRIKK